MRLGILGHPERAVVDSRGRLTTWGRWSLDWWISADDRWRLPGQEVAVRQRSIDGAPVVETVMRMPGGDVEHRAFAVASGSESWVVAEVQNRTAAPLAVAFAVSPAVGRSGVVSPASGRSGVVSPASGRSGAVPPSPGATIALDGSGGGVSEVGVEESWLVVDGSVAAALPRTPSQVATGVVPAGLIVYPLPHTASIRLLLPLHRVTPSSAVLPSRTPDAADVARGWALHLGRGPLFDLPDERLSEALAVARAQLLLGVGHQDLFSDLRDPDAMVEGTHPAELCMSVRRMLVDDTGGGLQLAVSTPAGWLGANWEVRDLPTTFGLLGYAVRWHGERPALLWELQAPPGQQPVTITAPGLDPTWSTTELSGETLLAAPAVPATFVPPPRMSQSSAPEPAPERSVPAPRPVAPPDEASSSFG